jgi:hypothetical protein
MVFPNLLENGSPVESLQKLLVGFCHPSKNQPTDNDDDSESTTDEMYSSEPDLASQEQDAPIRSKNAALPPLNARVVDEHPTAEGIELTLPEESTKKHELIKATYLGRRKRVVRGLGVAFVALLAVFTTLFSLHRFGYEMADFSFVVDDSLAGRLSKPLIQISYNEKKMNAESAPSAKTEPPASNGSIEVENPPRETDDPTVDRIQQKLDALKLIVAEIKTGNDL